MTQVQWFNAELLVGSAAERQAVHIVVVLRRNAPQTAHWLHLLQRATVGPCTTNPVEPTPDMSLFFILYSEFSTAFTSNKYVQ